MTTQKVDYPNEGATDRVRGATDAANNRLTDAGEKVRAIASGVAEQARQYGEKAQDAAGQFKPFVQRSLKEQPMTTLAGAAVIGFLLGVLWKR